MSKKKKINPLDFNTAITSWSGFIYQGWLALYHSLRLINDKGDDINYFIQLDSIEDFSILDENKTPISIHQVKAKKNYYYNSAKDAIRKLEENKRKALSNPKAYFHLSNQLVDKTTAEIEDSHKEIKVYEYHNGEKHCNTIMIQQLIKVQIEIYIRKKFNDEIWRTSENNIDILLNKLICIIESKPLEMHHNIQINNVPERFEAFKNIIQFAEIINVLQEDQINNIQNEEYFLWLTRKLLHRYLEEYINDLIIEEEVENKLRAYLHTICQLNDTEFQEYLINLSPHKALKYSNIEEFSVNGIENSGIKNCFLEILTVLPLADEDITIWKNESNSYFPTTIALGQRSTNSICVDIIKNGPVELLFDCNNLITSEINVLNISVNAPRITNVVTEAEVDLSLKITNYQSIGLISIDKLKEIYDRNN